ncbi:MAG TPA: PorV/PorQ family protein [bacterium]|jgi:tetratricopeptide (TPR) repeat protein|nr:PorV/PorQ family protein [bacterium]
MTSRKTLFSISAISFLSLLSFSNRMEGAETVYALSNQSNSLGNTNVFARPAALGSAFVGIADDDSALFINPAGLAFLRQGELSLNSDLWLVGTFQETVLTAIPTAHLGGFGFAGHYLDYGTFEGRDESGSLTNNYSADQIGADMGWGFEILKNFSVGLGLSGLQSTLAGMGYTQVTTDFGILWRLGQGIRLGASYTNMGLIGTEGTAESAFNLGASYQIFIDKANQLLAALAGTLEPNAEQYFQAGLEYGFQGQLFLRVGFQQPLEDNSIDGLTGLAAGVGFHLSGLSLDYAYLPYGDLGNSHRINLSYFFETLPAENSTSDSSQLPTGRKPSPGINGGYPNARVGTGTGYLSLGTSPSQAPVVPGANSIPALPSLMGLTHQAGSTTPGGASVTTPSQSPTAASPDSGKDNLVIQFDLPDNTPNGGISLNPQPVAQPNIQLYQNAIRQNPQDVSAWWNLGNIYRQLNQKENAVYCFEQVLKIQPNSSSLAIWLQQYKASQP